jgi:TrmH family RNA methyltransferase
MPLTKSELKYIRSLSQKKVRDREGKFLLEGWRPLQEALAAKAGIDLVLIEKSAADREENRKVLSEVRKRSLPLKFVTARELDLLSSTVHSQGVLAILKKKRHTIDELLSRKLQIVVAADGVSDPGNLGSIIRSCDWFGVDAVLLGMGCVELYNEKVLRATAGSIFHLPIVEQVDLAIVLAEAKRLGYGLYSLSADGSKSYLNGSLRTPCILIFGNEAHGVSAAVRSVSDEIVHIPSYGSAESLNVGVACGIVLAHLRSRFPTSPPLQR